MMKETLSQTTIIEGPLFALILFVLVFALVVIRALTRGKNDPRMQHLATLPLLDDAPSNLRATPPAPTSPSKELER